MLAVAQKRLWIPDWLRSPLVLATKPVLGPTGKPLKLSSGKPAVAEDPCDCCGLPPGHVACDECPCGDWDCPDPAENNGALSVIYLGEHDVPGEHCDALLRFTDLTEVPGMCFNSFYVVSDPLATACLEPIPGPPDACAYSDEGRVMECGCFHCGTTYHFLLVSGHCCYEGETVYSCTVYDEVVFTVPNCCEE